MTRRSEKYHALVAKGVNQYEAAAKAGYKPNRSTLRRLKMAQPPPTAFEACLNALPADLQEYYAASSEAQRLIQGMIYDAGPDAREDGSAYTQAFAELEGIRQWETAKAKEAANG
jgi:hypothetical protein